MHQGFLTGETLGEGGGATVVSCVHPNTGRRCAMKRIRENGAHIESPVERLRTEIALLGRVRHPNVVQVLAQDDGDSPWFVMELADGSVGGQVLAQGPLPIRRALQIIVQVLDGLAAIHAVGVIHRDIKPDNLLLFPDGAVKIADFGIAVERGAPHAVDAHAVGSLPYMAPEQRLQTGGAAPAADVFSAGATLYHLLTAGSPVDLFLAGPSSPRFAGLSEPLVGLIRRAMAAEVRHRYPSAEAMAEDVLTLLAELPQEEAPPPAALPPTEEVERVPTAEPAEPPASIGRLEQELHREWREEREADALRLRQRRARWSLAIAVTLLGIVVAMGGRLSMEDWIERQQAQRVARDVPIPGAWQGTVGGAVAEVHLQQHAEHLTGRFVWRRDGVVVEHGVRGVAERGLVFLDVVDGDGRYRGRIVEGGRLDGDYISVTKQVPFHLVRGEAPSP